MSYRMPRDRGSRTVQAPETTALTPGALRRIEGWIADTKRMMVVSDGEGDSDLVHTARSLRRLSVPAERIVATICGVSVGTVKDWIRTAETRYPSGDARRNRVEDLADHIAEIRQLAAVGITSALLAVAANPDHPRVTQAAAILLPRLDPECWGPQAIAVDVTSRREDDVYQIPQAVFDALTDDERDALIAAQQRIAADTAAIDALLTAAGQRAA